MVASTINIGEYSPYKFREEVGYVFVDSRSNEKHFYSGGIIDTRPGNIDQLRTLNLKSDSKKILASVHRSYYHFIVDFVAKLSYQLKIDSDVEVILDAGIIPEVLDSGDNGFQAAYHSVLEGLENLNIRYRLVNFNDYDVIEINNFYTLEPFQPDINYSKSLSDFYSFYIKDKNVKPYRKVFVSRRLVGNRPTNSLATWIPVGHDNRIDDFVKIEEYFRSLGFEIVTAESIRSFKDQVNLFYETSILVATSGSGLTNSIFMQENTTVVELFTPLVVGIPKTILDGGMGMINIVDPANNPQMYATVEEIHYYYALLSLHNNQKYMSIQNFDRSIDKIIDVIENDPYMKSFFHRQDKPGGLASRLLKR